MMAYASVVAGLSFVACLIALAISPARWETFKRMGLTLLGWAAAILGIGWVTARLLHSMAVAEWTGALLVSSSVLAAAIAGWCHIRAARSQ